MCQGVYDLAVWFLVMVKGKILKDKVAIQWVMEEGKDFNRWK